MNVKRATAWFFLLCAKVAVQHPRLILAVSLLLTLAATYASTTIKINASTEGLFSPNASFIRNARNYDSIFANRGDPIVAVIDAKTPERALAAAHALEEKLRNIPLFRQVHVPGSEPYFRRAGLLFMNVEDLDVLRKQLYEGRNALAQLAHQPNLVGIAKFIELIPAGIRYNVEIPARFSDFLQELANTVELQADGHNTVASWSTLFGFGELQERGKRQVVLSYPVANKSTLSRVSTAIEAARAAAGEISADRDVRIRLTGQAALDQQELDTAFSSAFYASVLSFGLVVLTLILGIKSWRLIFMLIAVLVIGSIWTSGLAALVVPEFNLISLAFGVLFFAIGVDFGTHLGLRYIEQAPGSKPRRAITRAILGEGPAITLSVICASIGFLSFLPTDYLGLSQLGLISALGMVAAFAVTLILLPAMLAIWPPTGAALPQHKSRFSNWAHRRAVLIVGLATVGTITAGVIATRARVDVNPLNLQDPTTEAVQVYRELARDPATSPYDVNLTAPNLEAARDLAYHLRGLDGVAEVRTIESFIPHDQEQKRAAVAAINEQFKSIEGWVTRELDAAELQAGLKSLRASANSLAIAAAAANLMDLRTAAVALLIALDRFSAQQPTTASFRRLDKALANGLWPFFDQLRQSSSSLTVNDLPESLSRDWISASGVARVQVLPAAEMTQADKLEAYAGRLQTISPTATGLPILITEAASVVRQSFAEAVVITAIGLIIIIALVRRRLADVILILTPLVLASLWTIAGSALAGLSFNFANVIAIPVLLGIGVASGIHVMNRVREMGKSDTSSKRSFLDSSTPRAVLLTDANTALAFIALAVSSHRGLFSLGLLLAIATSFSLLASLIVLPAILILLERKATRQAKAENATSDS
jgi:hypothetical protein